MVLSIQEKKLTRKLQMKVDNGPESSGVRTQFLKRMVEFSDLIRQTNSTTLLSPLP